MEQVFIPVGACWLNLQEAWWRLFRREALAGQSFADAEEIELATRVATNQLNHRARPWVWGRPPRPPRHRRRTKLSGLRTVQPGLLPPCHVRQTRMLAALNAGAREEKLPKIRGFEGRARQGLNSVAFRFVGRTGGSMGLFGSALRAISQLSRASGYSVCSYPVPVHSPVKYSTRYFDWILACYAMAEHRPMARGIPRCAESRDKVRKVNARCRCITVRQYLVSAKRLCGPVIPEDLKSPSLQNTRPTTRPWAMTRGPPPGP